MSLRSALNAKAKSCLSVVIIFKINNTMNSNTTDNNNDNDNDDYDVASGHPIGSQVACEVTFRPMPSGRVCKVSRDPLQASSEGTIEC